MNTSRRRFLQAVGAVAVGAAVDPELLAWRPGARTFFDLHRIVVPTPMSCLRTATLFDPERFGEEAPRDLVDLIGMEPINHANQALADAIDEQWPYSQEAISEAARSIADEIDARGIELVYEQLKRRTR